MDKHHIVPKHMGGLGPGHPQEHLNIMELSREDHAWAHLILYKLYGHDEDLWAAAQLGHPQADISGDKNPMANPIHRAAFDEALKTRVNGMNTLAGKVAYDKAIDIMDTSARARAAMKTRKERYGPTGRKPGHNKAYTMGKYKDDV